MDNTQDQTTSSGHTCRRCGWPFPNPHPNSDHRRAHNRVCGTIEGYTNLITDSDALSDHDHHHSDQENEKTPSPKIEKRMIKESGSSAGGIEERSNRSEDDRFSDAVTEFSDTGISPRVISEVKFEEYLSPLVKDNNGSHKDKLIDQMDLSDNKDQGKDAYTVSVPTDIPQVDKAETLIHDFKDHKTMYSSMSRDNRHVRNRSMADIFEVKTMQDNFDESQTIEESKIAETWSLEISKTVTEAAYSLISEAEGSRDKQPVVTLGQRMAVEIKAAEIDHSVVSDSKDSVKVGTSTVVNEGGGKLLIGQDRGVDVSFDSSSHNSLEGNWGSVSEISDVFGKSELSDDRSRAGRSDAFEGMSLMESEQETVDQSVSEIKEVKVQKSQPSKSEAIEKVTNWSTSGHIATTPLRKLMSEAQSTNPKPLSNMTQKDENGEKASESGKSTLTRENPKVNQESSSAENSGEGENDKKKNKEVAWWLKFMCCSMPIKRE